MRFPSHSRVAFCRRIAACLAGALATAGPAAAQVLPPDPARVDTVRMDSLRTPLVPPPAAGIPRIPTADAVPLPFPLPGPDRAAAGAPPASGALPTSTASPGLPRVELVSTARPVVLVRGAGAARPIAPPIESARVQIGADGQRTLVYSDRPAPPVDIGANLGCGPGAERAIIRLSNLTDETLLPGDEGPIVGAAQQLLCVVGYAVPPDGRFEPEMEAAVLAFQSDHNAVASPEDQLVVTGSLDEQTRRVLEARARGRLTP